MELEQAAAAFYVDGSLRDIYVHDVSVVDWEVVIATVRAHYPSSFMQDDAERPFPPTVAALFDETRSSLARLTLNVGGVAIACHFFSPDQIEFDVLPDDVQEPSRVAATLDFLRLVARATGRPAELTDEGAPAHVLIRATPSGALEFPSDTPMGAV